MDNRSPPFDKDEEDNDILMDEIVRVQENGKNESTKRNLSDDLNDRNNSQCSSKEDAKEDAKEDSADDKQDLSIDGSSLMILRWEIRDQLIIILNGFSSLLYNDETSNKTAIIDKNNKLLEVLIKLPIKLEIESTDEQPRKKVKLNNKKLKPILSLPSKLRIELIDHLIKNQNVLFYFDSVNEETKFNLINENKRVIHQLSDLPVSFLSDKELSSIKYEKSLEDTPTVHHSKATVKNEPDSDELRKQVKLLKDEIERMKATKAEYDRSNAFTQESLSLLSTPAKSYSLPSYSQTSTASLARELSSIPSNVPSNVPSNMLKNLDQSINLQKDPFANVLKNYLPNGNGNDNSTTFQTDLLNVTKFFEKDNEYFSEEFDSAQVKWAIKFKSVFADGKRFLGLFLSVKNGFNPNLVYKGSFDLIVISTTGENRMRSFNYSNDKDSNSVGRNKFISKNDLFDPKFGFISNNKLSVRACLRIESSVKTE